MAEIVATYDYADEDGHLLYQNVRFEPKDFRQRRADGNGGWLWSLDGVRRVLYRLPELLGSSRQDWVCVVEGEKDVESLRALGFTATTSGSANSWRPEFAEHFRGRLVCIMPDADGPGHTYAETVANSLRGVAGQVRIATLPDGAKDVSDFINLHDSLDDRDLRARIHAMIDGAKPVPAAAPANDEDEVACRPVYVWMKDVEAKPVEWLWQDRVPSAMLSLLIGLEGSGKTFVALDLAARISTGRALPGAIAAYYLPAVGNVVFLTSEDHLNFTVRPRLDAMKADPARIAALKGVQYPEGDVALFDVLCHLPALEALIQEAAPVRLVIVDPLTAFLGVTDQHRNGEVRMALGRFNSLSTERGLSASSHKALSAGSESSSK